MIGNKAFTDILLDLVTLDLGTNNFPSSWMHLTQPELQELTSLLTVNSEFVDWRKFLLVISLPWPVPSEEELLETLQRFRAVDGEQLGTVTFKQYMQAGLWFTGDEDIKIPENPIEPLPFNRQKHLIETSSFTNMSPIEEYPELQENFMSEERKLREKREEKEEIPKNANTEKISMETLFKVFRGGKEAQDTNRFASHLKTQNIYSESFIKVFQELGAKNLEPIELAVLLKHPFIQDLISSYSDYKIPTRFYLAFSREKKRANR